MADLTGKQRTQLLSEWRFWARPEQLAPAGSWRYWLYLAGRGAGKTRAGAEWIRQRVKDGARHLLLIAQTPADANDVMINGESGLLNIGPSDERPKWTPTRRLLEWPSGAVGHVRSGHDPEGVRGLQADTLWADELAAWQYPRETWDLAVMTMRLGDDPRGFISTTPKPISLLRDMLGWPTVAVTRGTTYDNLPNLAPPFVEQIIAQYEGTTIGQQEIYATLLDEAEGALWTRQMITQGRLQEATDIVRTVIGVDPAISAKAESNETGIIVAALDRRGDGHVLEDMSGRFSPAVWARRVVEAFERRGADLVVAEANQGGDMVRHTLHTEAPNLPVKLVHASKGKLPRAEPISALYEQGRIHHIGTFPTLEDQLCTWEPLGNVPSPDRLDALVWAMTELMPIRAGKQVSVAPSIGYQENYWDV